MNRDSAPNVAVFCDFENVALGVRDARYDEFDISLVLERILDKGKVVVKRAYADWERYKSAKRPMHEASFELIEIPHVSYSGKNSADIRLVVDALDLCHTKEHVDVFVIVSGDSDFSPLVSKLRENDKTVIGLGVKNSSSDLLIENCDEFIFYDDLVRNRRKAARKPRPPRRKPEEPKKPDAEAKKPAAPEKSEKLERAPEKTAEKADKPTAPAESNGDPAEAHAIVLDVVESLFEDRDGNLWGSMVKQVLKRKRPQFSESYYGYRTFNQLLEEMAKAELLEVEKEDKSGNYVILGFGSKA
ncbi:MAG: NYN domain-containing protein [Sandaracinus sp.]|nr:NYN domain-containing protein [Sandaracinus sp.]MCB9619080.1 NYN domain-containing protein [Sandaracinus sp.]MCB9622728.1 NYN domain-containing protein [Sandaracinus sp.]